MKETPLIEFHEKQGAKLVDFFGWRLPMQYTGIVNEHVAVRSSAGLFDISHMGQVIIEGDKSFDFLQKLITNDLVKAKVGHGIYTLICKNDGRAIDDLFVFCLNSKKFLLIINAARREADLNWIRENNDFGVSILECEDNAGIALQGPQSPELLGRLMGKPLNLGRHDIGEVRCGKEMIFVSRSGYTGEEGFEVFGSPGVIVKMVESLASMKKASKIEFCGLGARDTLRLEMGYMLYGQDIDENHTPIEAGLGWVVKLNKSDFIGKESLLKQKEEGIKQKIVGFKLKERGIPRQGNKILVGDRVVSEVTSGTFSPSLKIGIGMGYVKKEFAEIGKEIFIQIHGKKVPAEIVKTPFYKKT